MLLPVVLLPLLLLTEVAFAVERTINNTCPARLALKRPYYLKVRGDYCFYFVTTHLKVYSDANRDCIKDGGVLAMPKTKELNDFLATTLLEEYESPEPAWIGLHDKKKEGILVWEDHQKLGGWSNFARGNGLTNVGPDRRYEDCIALHPTDTNWHDYQCYKGIFARFSGDHAKKHYICQYTTGLPA